VVTLRHTQPDEAAKLADISRRAFDDDASWGGGGPGGPFGYACPEWQTKAMRWGRYLAIVLDGLVVGGIIVRAIQRGHYEIDRIFVDPVHHRKGIGSEAMRLLEGAYPDAYLWTLGTPDWNTRTPGFYRSLGYVCVGEDMGSLLFEQRVALGTRAGV
jgi:GNAT superfamily N-acetyltransferase